MDYEDPQKMTKDTVQLISFFERLNLKRKSGHIYLRFLAQPQERYNLSKHVAMG